MKAKDPNEYMSYNRINDLILEESENDPFNNYIYYFASEDNKNTSISIEFETPSEANYYGLNPSLSTDDIYDELLKECSHFASKEAIYEFAKSLEDDDLWSISQSELTKGLDQDFLVKCLLSMAQFFYIDLNLKELAQPEKFLCILDSENNNESDYRFSFYDVLDESADTESTGKIRVYGRLPDSILNKLDHENYRYVLSSKKITVLLKKEGQPFDTLYLEKEFKHLECTSEFFYNGVNIRLKKVVVSKQSNSNNSVQELKLIIERTTFGTICGFDGKSLGKSTHQENNVIGHPYLNSARQKLIKIVSDEAKLVCEFVGNLKKEACSPLKSIESLNQFLTKSIYPHYINISGNLITNDGYCIYTKRDNSVTDSGALYCSVNGVSEVMDPLVKHYHLPGADQPTIRYDRQLIQKFDGELDRESVCELGVSSPANAWSYYGFSLLGNIHGHKVDTGHFNILATKLLDNSYDNVKTSWLSAFEKKENQQLYGFKVQIHFGWFRTRISQLIELANETLQLKELIVVALYAGVRIFLIITKNLNLPEFINEMSHSVNSWIIEATFSFLFIVVFLNTKMLEHRSKKYKVKIKLCVLPKRDLKKYLKSIFKNKYDQSHPIVKLMVILHTRDKINQKINAVD